MSVMSVQVSRARWIDTVVDEGNHTKGFAVEVLEQWKEEMKNTGLRISDAY